MFGHVFVVLGVTTTTKMVHLKVELVSYDSELEWNFTSGINGQE